jgi:hypothetical protein
MQIISNGTGTVRRTCTRRHTGGYLSNVYSLSMLSYIVFMNGFNVTMPLGRRDCIIQQQRGEECREFVGTIET